MVQPGDAAGRPGPAPATGVDRDRGARHGTAAPGAPTRWPHHVRAHLRGVAAAALLLGGTAAVVLALTTARGPGPQTLPWLVPVLMVVAVLVVVVATLRERRLTHLLPPRGSLLAAAALLLADAALVTAGLVLDLVGGLVDRDVPLLAAGLVAVGVGTALVGLALPRHRRSRPAPEPATRPTSPRLAPVAAALGGALVVVLVSVGLGLALEVAPVRSTTADGPEEAVLPAEPVAPTEVAWARDVHDDVAEIFDRRYGELEVVAAGRGVAYRTERGVVALDGATGEERWRYELAGARTVQLTASPGGEHVVVVHESGTRGSDGGSRLVALDGTTGEVAGSIRGGGSSGYSGQYQLPLTSTHLVTGVDDETGEVSTWALDGSDERTLAAAAQGCELRGSAATSPAVVVLLLCGAVERGEQELDVRVAALAPGTGEELWRWDRTLRATTDVDADPGAVPRLLARDAFRVAASPDGSAVRVEVRDELGDGLVDLVLAAEDGRVVLDDAGPRPLSVVEGFTADATWGRLLEDGGESAGYGRQSADRLQRVADSVLCGRPQVDGGDALLGACFVDDDYEDPVIDVQVAPWDGGTPRLLRLEEPSATDRRPFPTVRVLPGVVVVNGGASATLFGLR
ncbi:PQQ-binding-like beta-propeller repeat protein [Pseudokineococcus marinus]|uniref:PQQ-binding-like beta-propeller repeat protein n=1 Tax=Pseudokineococcus marinus TaxID=351215 RepID=A0A849BT31_9ACTN|nr:PQQ-binding-like beta-propeller repeat protein [Pseudokineococcus marinus]NNH23614.1 PQQ-binding-like beta-propeller repeat protein [Pseudokineococcus marinus]